MITLTYPLCVTRLVLRMDIRTWFCKKKSGLVLIPTKPSHKPASLGFARQGTVELQCSLDASVAVALQELRSPHLLTRGNWQGLACIWVQLWISSKSLCHTSNRWGGTWDTLESREEGGGGEWTIFVYDALHTWERWHKYHTKFEKERNNNRAHEWNSDQWSS